MITLNPIASEQQFIPSENPPSCSLSLSELIDHKLLISPDSRKLLVLVNNILTDGDNEYNFQGESPVLYPKIISNAWINGDLPLNYQDNPLQQYVLLSQIKQSGEINAPLDSIPARKHQWRYREFCQDIEGVVLDIGSDKPSHSTQLLPNNIRYIGLDPYAGSGEFRLIGLGEVLPVASLSVNAVTFNTSLDHILDYHTAIDEAYRVLKPDGNIIIATYAWIEKATLLTDSVHFHHFREYEIFGALGERFRIDRVKRYEDPKHATHRYGLYVMATKK